MALSSPTWMTSHELEDLCMCLISSNNGPCCEKFDNRDVIVSTQLAMNIFVLGSRAWFFGVSPWFDYPIQKSCIMILLPIFMEAWANSFGTNCGLGNIKQRVRLTTTLHPLNRNLDREFAWDSLDNLLKQQSDKKFALCAPEQVM